MNRSFSLSFMLACLVSLPFAAHANTSPSGIDDEKYIEINLGKFETGDAWTPLSEPDFILEIEVVKIGIQHKEGYDSTLIQAIPLGKLKAKSTVDLQKVIRVPARLLNAKLASMPSPKGHSSQEPEERYLRVAVRYDGFFGALLLKNDLTLPYADQRPGAIFRNTITEAPQAIDFCKPVGDGCIKVDGLNLDAKIQIVSQN